MTDQMTLLDTPQRSALHQSGYCVVCADEITGKSHWVCSSKFCWAKWNNWTRVKDRWHELHGECRWCGGRFRYDRPPSEAVPGHYCSNDCKAQGITWGTPKQKRARTYIRRVRQRWERRQRDIEAANVRCVDCGELTHRGINSKRCQNCAQQRKRDQWLQYAQARHDRDAFNCKECGVLVEPEYGDKRSVFCSDRCGDRHQRREDRRQGKRSSNHRQRARRYGVPYEPGVTLNMAMRRDGARCGICGEKIDRRLRHPDPRSPSLDHIVPLSVEGSLGHVAINVQAAHLECNVRKGAGVVDADQLLLL